MANGDKSKVRVELELVGYENANDKLGVLKDKVKQLKELEQLKFDLQSIKGLGKALNQFSAGGTNFKVMLDELRDGLRKGIATEISGFNQNLKGVDKTNKTVAESLQEVNEKVEETGEVTKEAEVKLTGLAKVMKDSFSDIGKRLGIYASYRAINLMVGAVQESIGEVATLQKEFANIQAITASTDSQMTSLKNTIFKVGESTRFSNEELAKATVTLGQAGFSAEEIKSALGSIAVLASATGTDLAQSVQVGTSAITVWNMQASEMAHVADILTTAVNKTKAEIGTIAQGIQYAGSAFADLGVSLEESVALFAAVTNAGLKARSVVGTGSRALATELVAPTKKLQKQLEKLGLTLDDVDIRSRGLTNVLKTLKQAGFGSVEAFNALDRRAASFYLAATSQLNTMDMLRDAFLEEGAAMRANEIQMNTVLSRWQSLRDVMSETMNRAFAPALTIVTKLVELLTNLAGTPVGKLIGALGTLGVTFTTLKNIVLAFTKVLAVLKLKKVAEDTIAATSAIGKFTVAVKGLTTAIKAMLTSFGFWFGALQLVYSYWDDISKALGVYKKDLATVEGELQTNAQTTATVSERMTEMVEKSTLYSTNSQELRKRIIELNKSFKDEKLFLLDLSDSYEQVIAKMAEFRIQKQLEKTELLKEQQALLRTEHKGNIFDATIASFTGQGQVYKFKQDMYERLFQEVLASDEDERSAIQERIMAIKNAKERSAQLKIYNNALQVKLIDTLEDMNVSISENQFTAIDMSRNVAKFVTEQKKKFEEASSKFAKGEITEEEYNKVLLDVRETISSTYDKYNTKIKDIIEKNPNLGEIPNEVSSLFDFILDSLKGVNKTVENKIADSIKELDKEIKESSKRVEREKFFKEKGISVEVDGKKTTEELSQAVSEEKKYIEIKYKTLIEAEQEAEKKRELQRDRAFALAQVDEKATIKEHNQRLGSATRTLADELKRATQDIKRSISEIPEAREAKIQSGYLSGLSKAELSQTHEYAKTKEKIHSLELEATPKEIVLQEKLLEIQKSFAERNKVLLEGLKGNNEKKAEYNQTLETQLSIEKQILDTEERIAYLRGQTSGGKKTEELGIFDQAAEKWKKANENVKDFKQTLITATTEGIDIFAKSFTDAVKSVGDGSKSIGQSIKDMALSILKSVGDLLIELSIKALIFQALDAATDGWLKIVAKLSTGATENKAEGGIVGRQHFATGGSVRGALANRDSVNAKLMPGEFVMKKSAVSQLGEDFLYALNKDAQGTLSALQPGLTYEEKDSSGSVVNVWVVAEEQQAQMGPNDVIATISKDILTGGTTKRLIQSVVAGRK